MKKNKLFEWMSYFILLNGFVIILFMYWFLVTHLMIEKSSDKIDIITHSSGSKVVRIYTCNCNRIICYLEEMGLSKTTCRVKSFLYVK